MGWLFLFIIQALLYSGPLAVVNALIKKSSTVF
jgi:hypothetical protein